MARVTYLFGAGASAEVLPTVEKIPEGLEALALELEVLKGAEVTASHESIDEFKADLDWLAKKVKKHASVDTYAKKLWITSDYKSLNRVKKLLSLYFLHIQDKKSPDKRYDSFFASIIKTTVDQLPPSIRIVSWNYDHQLELAFREFTTIVETQLNRSKLGCLTQWSDREWIRRWNDPSFSVVKLNGTASFFTKAMEFGRPEPVELDDFHVDPGPGELWHLLEMYKKATGGSESFNSCIAFAWENDSDNNFLENCIKRVCETEVLVVVGYSFPFFNRGIDTKIIGSMSGLTKVYFQDPQPDKIRQRFISLDLHRTSYDHEKYELIDDVNQFFLPPELEL